MPLRGVEILHREHSQIPICPRKYSTIVYPALSLNQTHKSCSVPCWQCISDKYCTVVCISCTVTTKLINPVLFRADSAYLTSTVLLYIRHCHYQTHKSCSVPCWQCISGCYSGLQCHAIHLPCCQRRMGSISSTDYGCRQWFSPVPSSHRLSTLSQA